MHSSACRCRSSSSARRSSIHCPRMPGMNTRCVTLQEIRAGSHASRQRSWATADAASWMARFAVSTSTRVSSGSITRPGGQRVRRDLHLPGRQPRKLARAPALGLRTRPRSRRQRGDTGVHGGERRRRTPAPTDSSWAVRRAPSPSRTRRPWRPARHRRERDPAGRGHRRGRGRVPQGGPPRFGHAVHPRQRRSRAERRQRDGRRGDRASARSATRRAIPTLHINADFTIVDGASTFSVFNCSSSGARIRVGPTGHLIKAAVGQTTSDTAIDNDGTTHGPGRDAAPHGRHGQRPGSDQRRRLRGGRGGHARSSRGDLRR